MVPDFIKDFSTRHPDVWDLLKDIAVSIAAVILILMPLYLYSGSWPPIISVASESMVPHMDKGDLVIIQGLDRGDVKTSESSENNGYDTFGEAGDVIVYRPHGQANVTPVIHRAIRWVNEGEPMWPNGPPAPHAGYITLGDANGGRVDQGEPNICLGDPVEKEWVIGIARYRIPYLGYVRMLLPF